MVRDWKRTPCLELVRESFCPEGDLCPFQHVLPHCSVCDRYFPHTNHLAQHLKGAPHLKRVKQAAREQIPKGSTKCEVCGVVFPSSLLVNHTNTATHRRAAGQKRHAAATAYGEAPKHGVSMSPSALEFGHVELSSLDTLESTVTKELYIDAGSTGCYLKEIKLHSAVSRRNFSVPAVAPQGVLIPRNGRYKIPVVFHPRQTLGHFSDVLTASLTLQGKGEPVVFAIRRSISAVVAVQADIDAHGPITPFVPRPKASARPRAQDKDVVPGPKDFFKPNQPWVHKLPMYPIPKRVREALAGDDIPHQIRMTNLHLLPTKLTYEDYATWWSILLYVEQRQAEVDIIRYDMTDVPLVRQAYNNTYSLAVPGLAENRPSVLRGDAIKLRVSGSNERWYEGIVQSLSRDKVDLRFHMSFRPSAHSTFDCQFSVPRIPARRMQLCLASPLPRMQLLFPTIRSIQASPLSQDEIVSHPPFINSAIERNAQQAHAVRCIFRGTSGLAPFLVWGPPGTGKTVTIIEACLQLLRHTTATILISAPSNAACDLLATRLIDGGLKPADLHRLMATSRSLDDVPDQLKRYCYTEQSTFTCPPLPQLRKFPVIVTTCISASILYGVGLERGHFTHIFLDESGQATETEALLPISMANETTRIVMAGDPKQLGPIIRSGVATAFGLDISLLERLMALPAYSSPESQARGMLYVKLLDNYRNHPKILEIPNSEFYANELVVRAPRTTTHRLDKWNGWPTKGFPFIFHAMHGKDDRSGNSPSFFNIAEVSQVKRYVESLRSGRLNLADKDIGIISPYASQVRSIRKSINAENIMVGSTEQFQGQERAVMIISTVRSNKEYLELDKRFSLGFLSNPKRFNVSLTRAQAGCIIVGDPDILALDPLWRRLLIFIHRNGGWAGSAWDPTPFDNPRYDPARAARQDMDRLAEEMEALQMTEPDAEDGGVTAVEVGWVREE